jgi:hypothetical protein
MKMRHEEIQRLLHTYLDSMLDEKQLAEVESHLRLCDNCRRELDYLQMVMCGIETYPRLEAPPNFAGDVISKLQATSQHRHALKPVAPLLELPNFLFITISTSLRESTDYYYLLIVSAIQKTKRTLTYALFSTTDNLKINFSNNFLSVLFRIFRDTFYRRNLKGVSL